jgi:fructose-1,6-bisphosphatase
MTRTPTLASHVSEERRRGLAQDVGGVLLDVAEGVKAVAAVLARAVVCGAGDGAGCEEAARIADLASELLLDACAAGGHVSAVASADVAEPRIVFRRHARCVVTIAPLDAPAALAVNATVGHAFSVLRQPQHLSPGAGAFLQPGERQVAAGYVLYGPCTMLVATAGREVNGFTLDVATGELVLTHRRMRVPEAGRELAIDAPTSRGRPPWLRRYVDECAAGREGPRGEDFEIRACGAGPADVHRLLVRGGIVARLDAGDAGDAAGPRAPRLVFEANPLALLVERAGGAASTGSGRVLDVVPRDLHERVPAFLGARSEIERLASYRVDADGDVDRLRAG